MSSSSIALGFEAFGDRSTGPILDPSMSMISWMGGFVSPSVVAYEEGSSNRHMTGTLVFQGLPIAEPLSFRPATNSRRSIAIAPIGQEEQQTGGGGVLQLTVQTISGNNLATLCCSHHDTVYEVKQRLVRFSGALVGQQQLVYGSSVLQDCDTLASCGITGEKATMHYVRIKSSGISRYLAERRDTEDPFQALERSLADVVDSAMQSEHALSERARPRAADLAIAMTASCRAELISWMVQAFDALRLDDNVLHSTASLLDRYYARREVRIEDTALHGMLLAAACTVMKTGSLVVGWRTVLGHLCQGQLDIPTVLRTEVELLGQIGFQVFVPTPVTFLDTLCLRLRAGEPHAQDATRWQSLALFLLELVLFDAELQYGYPHAVLAAGALSAALRTTGAPPERYEALAEDLATYCPSLVSAVDMVGRCEEDLLKLWSACDRGECQWRDVYLHVKAKFQRMDRSGVARLSPDESLRQIQQAADRSRRAGAVPDDGGRCDEAV